ncbi:MAG: SMP-30/gluconolactonase/LRE family protein, partial [Nitriliruptorales bacterium]
MSTQASRTPEPIELASGLRFPEGPVAMQDGSVVVVEIAAGKVTRIAPDGSMATVAEPGGGPNGASIGPDGKLYVCNNGAAFDFVEVGGITLSHQPPTAHEGGRIERIDLESGESEVLYEDCGGRRLIAPNDLVFDGHDGFYFTDYGIRHERASDRTGIYYATADGSEIREVVFPLDCPNGVGLSPDGSRLYVAETYTACVWWWEVTAPGEPATPAGLVPHGGNLLARLPGFQFLDSLAVEADGNVCVATPGSGRISVLAPDDGALVEFVETGDPLTTNVCFGGEGLRTAYVTLSGTGRLVSFDWPRRGLELAHS